MLRLTENTPLILTEFLIGDTVRVPEVGNVTIAVNTISGVELLNQTTPFDSDFSYQGGFALGEGLAAQFLKLKVSFQSEGISRYYSETIRLEKDLPIFVTPEQVRNFLGVSDRELELEEIDLYASYISVAEILGDLLVIDDNTVADFNNLIMYHAALVNCFSLELRLLKSTAIDDVKKTRLSKGNLKPFIEEISSKYNTLLAKFDPEQEIEPTQLVEVVARTDLFTGA